jgi:arylsulfatase A-like enzyme
MKNIVVLLIDTIRASDVHANQRLSTISYLARNGTNYTNAIAPGTWTAPTHASLFVNQRVSKIRNVSKDFFNNGSYKIDPWMVKTKFLDSDATTIAQKMHGLGYYSMLFSNNPFLSSFTNLALGFDRIYDLWMNSNLKYNRSLVNKLSVIINGGAGARMAMFRTSHLMTSMLPKPILDGLYLNLRNRLADGVANADGTFRLDRGARDANNAMEKHLTYDYNYKPSFIFVNYMEGHENYPISRRFNLRQDKWLYLSGIEEMTPEVMGKLHDGYLKRLGYLDARVKDAISILKSKGMLEDATVVVTSDHGQSFGEHGLLYHSMFPYQEISHVPLIAVNYKNGKIVKVKDRVEEPVSILALHESLLDLASGKAEYLNGNLRSGKCLVSEHTGICEGWDESLLRMLKSRSKNAESIYNAKSSFNIKATAVYKGDMKLLHFFGKRKDELYDLSRDPGELENVINDNRAVAKDLIRSAAS